MLKDFVNINFIEDLMILLVIYVYNENILIRLNLNFDEIRIND